MCICIDIMGTTTVEVARKKIVCVHFLFLVAWICQWFWYFVECVCVLECVYKSETFHVYIVCSVCLKPTESNALYIRGVWYVLAIKLSVWFLLFFLFIKFRSKECTDESIHISFIYLWHQIKNRVSCLYCGLLLLLLLLFSQVLYPTYIFQHKMGPYFIIFKYCII